GFAAAQNALPLVSLMLLVVVVLAGAGLIVDGGRVMAARRHASNVAEAAARAAVSSTTPVRSYTESAARAAALDAAARSGVEPADVVVVVRLESVTVTITERRRSVFLVLGGWETVTVRGTGTARVVYSG
ncbi:MAG: pilus assembly protein TadG-related protein, partial [Ilumatobacteraceae bacterium]